MLVHCKACKKEEVHMHVEDTCTSIGGQTNSVYLCRIDKIEMPFVIRINTLVQVHFRSIFHIPESQELSWYL